LAELAHASGHGESSHVVWLGRSGAKDWELMPLILEGDWILVTNNAVDFRGSAAKPGKKGLYAALELHAGLVCLNGPEGMTRPLQIELFSQALAELKTNPDLVNQALEVPADDAMTITVRCYALLT
jgi:hypothetical protein